MHRVSLTCAMAAVSTHSTDGHCASLHHRSFVSLGSGSDKFVALDADMRQLSQTTIKSLLVEMLNFSSAHSLVECFPHTILQKGLKMTAVHAH